MGSMSDLDRALQKEYLHLSAVWDDFDRRVLTIKGWTAAGSIAVMFAWSSKVEASMGFAVGLALVVIAMWVLEAQWKVFQHSNAARIDALEAHFAGTDVVRHPFQSHLRSRRIREAWGPKALLTWFWKPFVWIPYLPLLAMILLTIYVR
jgi:hypothetical protein